jgi:hypothetical protein
LQDVLNIWQLLIRDNCLKNLSLGELATDDHEPLPGEWEQKTLKQIAAAGGLLADNINPRLIFENILLTLP